MLTHSRAFKNIIYTLNKITGYKAYDLLPTIITNTHIHVRRMPWNDLVGLIDSILISHADIFCEKVKNMHLGSWHVLMF